MKKVKEEDEKKKKIGKSLKRKTMKIKNKKDFFKK